jgi:hypothetical protein
MTPLAVVSFRNHKKCCHDGGMDFASPDGGKLGVYERNDGPFVAGLPSTAAGSDRLDRAIEKSLAKCVLPAPSRGKTRKSRAHC